jgi:arginine exporter protein ArgO
VFVLFLFLACVAVAVFRAMLDRSIDQERERESEKDYSVNYVVETLYITILNVAANAGMVFLFYYGLYSRSSALSDRA